MEEEKKDQSTPQTQPDETKETEQSPTEKPLTEKQPTETPPTQTPPAEPIPAPIQDLATDELNTLPPSEEEENTSDDDLDIAQEEYKPHGLTYYVKMILALILAFIAALMIGEGIMRFQGSSLTTFFAAPLENNNAHRPNDVDFGDLENDQESDINETM